MQDKWKAALIGGAALGVASGVPLVNIGNCFCCAWVIAGGLLAAFLYQRQPVSRPGTDKWLDAVVLGLVTGVIGALVSMVVSIPFTLAMDAAGIWDMSQFEEVLAEADLPPEVMEALESMEMQQGLSCFGLLFGLAVSMVIYPLFATIGSLLGTAIFRRPPAPPAV